MKLPSRFHLMVLLACSGTLGAQTCPSGNPRNAPNSRYIDHGNGTVTDTQTALMWKQCSEGQSGAGCSGGLSEMDWQEALATAGASGFAGYSDWRLPSVKELQSLVETGCYSPAINGVLYPGTPNSLYWSSTTIASNGANAWLVGFADGHVTNGTKSFQRGVRLVRGTD